MRNSSSYLAENQSEVVADGKVWSPSEINYSIRIAPSRRTTKCCWRLDHPCMEPTVECSDHQYTYAITHTWSDKHRKPIVSNHKKLAGSRTKGSMAAYIRYWTTELTWH